MLGDRSRRFRLAVVVALGTAGCASIIGLEAPTPSDADAGADGGGNAFIDAPATGDAPTDDTAAPFIDAGLPAPDADTLLASHFVQAWNDGAPRVIDDIVSMAVVDAGVMYVDSIVQRGVKLYRIELTGTGAAKSTLYLSPQRDFNDTTLLVADLGSNTVGIESTGQSDASSPDGATGPMHIGRRIDLNDAGQLFVGNEPGAFGAVDIARSPTESLTVSMFDPLVGGGVIYDNGYTQTSVGHPLGVFVSAETTGNTAPLQTTLLSRSDAGAFGLSFFDINGLQAFVPVIDTNDASGAFAGLTNVVPAHGDLVPWFVGMSADEILVGSFTNGQVTMTPAVRFSDVSLRSAATTADHFTVAGGCVMRSDGMHPFLAAFQNVTFSAALAATDYKDTCVETVRIDPSNHTAVVLLRSTAATKAGTLVVVEIKP